MVFTERASQHLREYIERQLPTLNAPGVAIGLTHRERVLYVGSYGLANRETGEAVTPDTLFEIGSISKSFASIILLQLQEQGILDVNDPVKKHLPWFEVPSEFEPITLRHLMSHTAGIVTGSDETVSAHTEVWNLRYTKATAPPGEMFHYSNSGYKVLGLVLQSVLGQDIAEILRERILAPLGMDATFPVIRTDMRSRLATGNNPFYDDRPLPPGGLLAPATWFESDTADGSICSNAEDMCRYIQALLQHGKGLLTPQSFEQLIAPAISVNDDAHEGYYGLGLSIQELDEKRVIGHSGGMVGYAADMLADLEAGLGVIVLTNGPSDPKIISRFALKLLRAAWNGDEFPDAYPEKNEAREEYTGTYIHDGKSFALTFRDGRIYLDFESATFPLEPLGPDRFIVPHPAFELFPLQFRRENDRITEASHGGESYVRTGIQGKPALASPAEWQAYPGHYRSHNPWLSNFRVVLRKGALVFIDPAGEDEPLYQLEPGLFRIGEDPRSPEFIRFDVVIDGKAMQAILSGGVYSRTFTP